MLGTTDEQRSDSDFPAIHGKGMREDTPNCLLDPQDQRHITNISSFVRFGQYGAAAREGHSHARQASHVLRNIYFVDMQ